MGEVRDDSPLALGIGNGAASAELDCAAPNVARVGVRTFGANVQVLVAWVPASTLIVPPADLLLLVERVGSSLG